MPHQLKCPHCNFITYEKTAEDSDVIMDLHLSAVHKLQPQDR